MFWVWGVGQDGMMAGGMEAEDDFVSRRFFDAQALAADGHATIGADLERATVSEKGGGQEIEIREQKFTLIKFGAGEEATAIIEHVEHGEGNFRTGKPAVW